MTLTPPMQDVLAKLSEAPSSSYRMACSQSTLHALNRRGLVAAIPASGDFAFPHTATWRITAAARQALASSGGRN